MRELLAGVDVDMPGEGEVLAADEQAAAALLSAALTLPFAEPPQVIGPAANRADEAQAASDLKRPAEIQLTYFGSLTR